MTLNAAVLLMAGANPRSRGPGLIDEHEARRVEIKLIVEPLLPSSQDVRPVLLGRVCGLFLRVIRRRAKKRQSVP